VSDTLAKRLNIAIDFDDTFSADPELWRLFIDAAEAKGHRCYIVYTSHAPKDWYCRDKGIAIDIWCDDYPLGITEGR
jgi:hypothetical protein